jgi:hypothetical protein
LVKEASDEPVPEAEATEAADDSSSEDAFGTPTPEVADSASAGFASPTPQEVAVNPTSSEPTEPPTATPVPPTATDAPPAPVNEGANADPLALDTAVCVLMFNDSNQNNIRDANEGLLGSGIITLRAENSSAVQEYVTTGETEAYCYLDLEPGDYNVSAIAPDGYGLRKSSLLVNVPPGVQFMVRFPAVAGLVVTPIPTASPNNIVTDSNPDIVEEDPPASNSLRNIAGIIVFALAGVILVGGVGAAVVASRR